MQLKLAGLEFRLAPKEAAQVRAQYSKITKSHPLSREQRRQLARLLVRTTERTRNVIYREMAESSELAPRPADEIKMEAECSLIDIRADLDRGLRKIIGGKE